MGGLKRLTIETRGPSDWRSRLAEPEKQWVRGYSAFETAISWEIAARQESGLPEPIRRLFDHHSPLLGGAKLLIAIAEHKVPVKDGRRPSQNDVWALIKTDAGLLSLAVEAKAGEPFGEMVSEWLASAKPGSKKPERLKELRRICAMPEESPCDLRYQLLHRTASALIEAERFGAGLAAMVVQSFPNVHRADAVTAQLSDFRIFGLQLGVETGENRLVKVPGRAGVQLYLGWATCEPASDSEIAAVS